MPPSPHAPEIIDLLLTVGYIDGVFHERERAFVHHYLESLVERTERASPAIGMGMGIGIGVDRVLGDDRGPFDAIFEKLEAEIAELAHEVTPAADSGFVKTRLEVRAVTLFANLPPAERGPALELVRALIAADGTITAPEQGLFAELSRLFADASAHARPVQPPMSRPLTVTAPLRLPVTATSHPLLDPYERAYAADPNERHAQAEHDWQLANQAIARWNLMREQGRGRLAGIADIAKLAPGARFLDGHVHVMRPDRAVELIVVGDLHGCYACLKAAVLQSGFLERAAAHQRDPRAPEVKLVFLGDYVDRGRYGMDGVLRTVLRLFLALPDDVIVLRGNHEHFMQVGPYLRSAVAPAETIASIGPHVPRALLDAMRALFEEMPTSFVVDRTLFVHGGIPRDDTFAAKFRDLSCLNDPEVRFQMMWSDPAQTDHVPVELQRKNPRFSFGRRQFDTFMRTAGLTTMIRGHDKIDDGFEVIFDGAPLLLNLFSAGGADNDDLPPNASYRSVTPMALTIEHTPTSAVATPWAIDYQRFNTAPVNGFRRGLPSLPFVES